MGLSCFKSWKHDSAGHKGNRDVLASPGSYFFLSNSAGQGDEWLKSLNKGVWIPFTGVFGQSLEETVLYERRYGMRLVPLVVEQCVTFIRERGMHEVGLFRQPGRASLVKELQEAFDAGERPSFDSNTDVHTVASLLKLYLRQLPEPLVPYCRYQEFLLCAQKLSSERTLGTAAPDAKMRTLGELRNLLRELPVANFNLLDFICQFLNEVQTYSGSNKMSVQNLATVFGPNILRAKAEDPQSIVGGAALVQVLMLELIREHESLFSKIPPSACARLPGGLQATQRALTTPHLHPLPCLRQLSLPVIAEPPKEAGQSASDTQSASCMHSAAAKPEPPSGQKRRLGHRYTSSHPENCFYPQPSSSHDQLGIRNQLPNADQRPSTSNFQASLSSFKPQNAEPDSSKARSMLVDWEKAWPGLTEAGSSSWVSGAAEEQAAMAETASGGSSEAQEDSTVSAYDNLHSLSPCQSKEEVSSEYVEAADPGGPAGTPESEVKLEEGGQKINSSPSWSSCEVLPLDEGDDSVGVAHLNVSQMRRRSDEEHSHDEEHKDKSQKEDDDEEDDDVHNYHPSSPVSCSVHSDSPLSTGSSDVFLPCGSPDLQEPEPPPQPGDSRSLMAEMQQQMVQQRAEHQARIRW